tara:strand:+ start:1126 stop:2127 length:1002 start_codon:yes stop_codon:yes gene_type:complete
MNTKNNEDTYYAVLKQALSDGVVDNNEWEMLENLRSNLTISLETHFNIEKKIRQSMSNRSFEKDEKANELDIKDSVLNRSTINIDKSHKIINETRKNIDSYLRIIKNMIKNLDYKSAIKKSDRALQEDDRGDIWAYKAECFSELKKYERSYDALISGIKASLAYEGNLNREKHQLFRKTMIKRLTDKKYVPGKYKSQKINNWNAFLKAINVKEYNNGNDETYSPIEYNMIKEQGKSCGQFTEILSQTNKAIIKSIEQEIGRIREEIRKFRIVEDFYRVEQREEIVHELEQSKSKFNDLKRICFDDNAVIKQIKYDEGRREEAFDLAKEELDYC